jgi:oligogalacturonide transporter
MAGIWVSTRFRLNSATHDVLMAEIDRLKSGDTSPPTAETRAIVEDLTGWKYEQLWGNNPVAHARPKEQTA